jgi:hypothetical protein
MKKSKRCRYCKQSIPIDLFARAGVDFRRPECKLCRKQRRAELAQGAPRCRPWTMEGVYR